MRCITIVAAGLYWLIHAGPAFAVQGPPYCGGEGVWLQTLGGGGPEIDDRLGSASYLVWLDGAARLLVDPAPGSALRFDQSGARIEDLDAIAISHLHADHVNDLAAFIAGSTGSERERPLPVLGPDGNDEYPSTMGFVERLFAPSGLYPYLAETLTFRKGGYKVAPRDVPSTGQRRWAQFGTANLRLAAIPVHHGSAPALAWRVEIGDHSITFGGDDSNQKNTLAGFAKGSSALVMHHAIAEGIRGELRGHFAEPSQIGRIAAEADVRMLILGHRTNMTRGRETQSSELIRQHFSGPLIFANDLECWGL